ncbi:Tubulin specific chaperone D [Giardia lamblia P15]|uniref:Tubulin specific chaperone D n=1 Tax=Giardia intestinalis (strain P15) TaxID=658858 RepID=E1F5D4_GIAIA|nr:Tubulin specific chaperone D [Giardia lamblia P15]
MPSADIIADLISLTERALKETVEKFGYQLALRYGVQIREYLESPRLLDTHLTQLAEPLTAHLQKDIEKGIISQPWLYTMLYLLVEVRQLSAIACYFPNSVTHLEPCIHLLSRWYGRDAKKLSIANLDKNNPETDLSEITIPSFNDVYDEKDVSSNAKQQIVYVLFASLSILVGVPFDIHLVDSNGALPDTVVTLAKQAFETMGKEYIIAAEMLARFVTRPDLRDTLLPSILNELNMKLKDYIAEVVQNKDCVAPILKRGRDTTINQTPAYLITLSYIVRFSERDHINLLGDSIIETPEQTLSILLKDDSREIRRLCIVLSTRLASMYLPTQLFRWREQILDTGAEGILLHHDKLLELDGFYVPPSFDYFIDSLLVGISDDDTGIRLSSARGLALVVGRLPFLFADEVIAEILSYFSPAETPEMWHGANMALGELIRHGYLPPSRISEVFDVTKKSLRFERKKGAWSIVKDSACFVSWALARVYSSSVQLRDVCSELASELLVVACFDREINLRRSAAAAFQELAGRVGDPYVPSAVLSSALVDYFSLGARKISYMEIAPRLASLDKSYAESFIGAICDRYLVHWDDAIRDCAARALPLLIQTLGGAEDRCSCTLRIIDFLVDCLRGTSCEDDWVSYCGFILGIANSLTLLTDSEDDHTSEINTLILRLSTMQSELFAKGRRFKDNADANTNIISATALLIKAFAHTNPNITGETILNKHIYSVYLLYLLSVLEHSITSTIDSMSIAMFDTSNTNDVILALRALADYYTASTQIISERATSAHVMQDVTNTISLLSNEFFKDCLENADFKSQLAYLTGLGLLPASFRREEVNYILSAILTELNKGISPSGYVIRLYILSTVESTLLALDNIIDTQKQSFLKIFNVCLHDYSSNQRGDVGSLVRLKSFRILRSVLRKNGCVTAFLNDTYIRAVIEFLGSRIDIIRIDSLISFYEDCKDGIVSVPNINLDHLEWYMQDYIAEKKIVSQMKEQARRDRQEREEIDSNNYLYDLHKRESRDDDPLDDDSTINLLTLVPRLAYTAFNVLIVLFIGTDEGYTSMAAAALSYSFGVMSETTSTYLVSFLSEVFDKSKKKTLLTGSTSNRIHMPDDLKLKLLSLGETAKLALYDVITQTIQHSNLTDSYTINAVDASIKLLNFLLVSHIAIESDSKLFELLGSLIALSKGISRIQMLQIVVACFAGAGVVAKRSGYTKTYERAIKGLVLFLGHKISRLRDTACDGILEVLLIISPPDDLTVKRAVEVLTSYDWPILTTTEINYARNELCEALGIAPPPEKK